MTDRHHSPGPHDPAHPISSDAELGADELDRLVGRLRDVPAPTASVRAAHITAALGAFDDLGTPDDAAADATPATPIAPVTSISSAQRRRLQFVQRSAVAAVVVLVVGVGIGFVVQSNSSSDDTASDTAVAMQSKADEQVSSESAADAAAPASAAAGGQDLASPSGVLQLGEVDDDEALRFALLAGRRAEAATASREAAESEAAAENDSNGMAVGGSDAPVTTAARAPGTDDASCVSSYPPGAVVIAEATLAGRPVRVLEAPGPVPAVPVVTTVVDLADCSTRPL